MNTLLLLGMGDNCRKKFVSRESSGILRGKPIRLLK